jgi:peptidase M1-like protein
MAWLPASTLPFLLPALRLGAATPVSPSVVEYTIQAKLDPKTHIVEGEESLVWRNPSSDMVRELQFHLYLNAFKNNRSTFARESGGQLRGDKAGTAPEDWGWIDVVSMKTQAGADLKSAARFLLPDGDAFPHPGKRASGDEDQTVLAVPLPSPVSAHGELTLSITFRSKLPKVFARTGYVRDFHLVGQWFPKIGVYEPAGMRGRAKGGWNCHTFHANSEFYADYGRYDVTLTVPSSYVVGATGVRVSEAKKGDLSVYRYVVENVHDFAWTADPRYLVHEFRFDPSRDIPRGWSALASKQLGLSEADIALKPVSVRLLLQPDHRAALERYVRSTREALSFYGLWFGPYPYETLTVVDPPEGGFGAGGMEYPTFITGDAPSLSLRWPFDRVRIVEDVTIHEFGHQYWYGMVGSNEFEESWLDEGINTDSEYRVMQMAYGPRPIALPGDLGMDMYTYAYAAYASLPNLDPIRHFAWNYFSGASYGTNSYPKVGLFLAQLRNDLGAETFARAQRAYFQQWSFRHPTTSDFFDVFERVCRCDLSTYRRNIVEGTARLDWSTVSAKSEAEAGDSGVFDRAGGRATYEKGRQVLPKKEEKAKSSDKEKVFESTVVFGNRGEWPHAAKARLVFEDGTVLDRPLPAEARWVRLRIRYKSKLAWAAVDPDRVNTWDINRLNDSIVLGRGKGAADTAGGRAVTKYFAKAAYLIGLFLQGVWTLA